jgi:hypothetical protein
MVVGDSSSTQTGVPTILSSVQTSVQSDGNGLARFVPTTGSFTGLLDAEIQISAGTAALIQDVLESFPP